MPELAGKFEVIWKPFFLRRNIPSGGMTMQEYFGRPVNERAAAHIRTMGEQVGIHFLPSQERRIWPTMNAHMLCEHVLEKFGWEKQNAVIEQLFAHNFEKGSDVEDRARLLRIAEDALGERVTAEEAFSDELRYRVDRSVEHDVQLFQITGVPFFIFENPATGKRLGASGAQPPETLAAMLKKVSSSSRI